MDLKQGAGLELDKSLIPESLHGLIPLVEKWGFGSLEDQDQFVLKMQAENPGEVSEFNRLVDGSREAIVMWRRTLTEFDQHKSAIDEKSWEHPYWSFLAVLKIREITEPGDSPEALAARSRMSAEARSYRFVGISEQAAGLFRKKEYQEFIDILEPFEDLLSDIQKKKPEYAKRQLQ